MILEKIPTGDNIPVEFNVIVEISANSSPIKYEMNKDYNGLCVDRFVGTGMVYPFNYGFIPHTLSEDGDPSDVVLITPFPVLPCAVISCRALGILRMEDESGVDTKILAVPTIKICPMYANITDINHLPQLHIDQIKYFFEHYKGLEPSKWVKITGWDDITAAHNEITSSIKRYIA